MKNVKKRILLTILDLVTNLVVIGIMVAVIQTWIIAPFDVSGASMCDTLNYMYNKNTGKSACTNTYGEKIIINEAGYLWNDPQRGDIVVFKPKEDFDRYFIKRVIGLPGETVEIKNGKTYITNPEKTKTVQLDEKYLNKSNYNNTKTYFDTLKTFEVPEGKYFVMGDNRKESTDSRSCFQSTLASNECIKHPEEAFVDRNLIRGKTWVVWWPIRNIRVIKHMNYSTIDVTEPQNP